MVRPRSEMRQIYYRLPRTVKTSYLPHYSVDYVCILKITKIPIA